MEFFYNYIWEKGYRDNNEDSLCIRQVVCNNRTYLLAVVCDGIGGLPQGETASSYVAGSMLESFQKMVKRNRNMPLYKMRNQFCRQIYRCHRVLQKYGQKEGIELGTTLSMLVISDRRGIWFHIGDSALFCGKKRLRRKTINHSSEKGALTQAVGNGRNPKPQTGILRIHRNWVYVLASDGFYRKYEEKLCDREWISGIVCDEKKIGEWLIHTKEKVQRLGERDNISAVCIRVSGKR